MVSASGSHSIRLLSSSRANQITFIHQLHLYRLYRLYRLLRLLRLLRFLRLLRLLNLLRLLDSLALILESFQYENLAGFTSAIYRWN